MAETKGRYELGESENKWHLELTQGARRTTFYSESHKTSTGSGMCTMKTVIPTRRSETNTSYRGRVWHVTGVEWPYVGVSAVLWRGSAETGMQGGIGQEPTQSSKTSTCAVLLKGK